MSCNDYEFYYIRDGVRKKYLAWYDPKFSAWRDNYIPDLDIGYSNLKFTRYIAVDPTDSFDSLTKMYYISPNFEIVESKIAYTFFKQKFHVPVKDKRVLHKMKVIVILGEL